MKPNDKVIKVDNDDVPMIISDSLANLREIYQKLDAIDTREMDIQEQRVWFREYTSVRHAIIVLEDANIQQMNDEAERQAADMAKAISNCEDTLHGVQDSEKIIAGVSSVLGSITALVSVFA